jgi:hypothetical protein
MSSATRVLTEPRLSIQRGREVLVDGQWYPIIGFALSKDGTTGTIYTDVPRGKFKLMGYEIDYSAIEDVREESY